MKRLLVVDDNEQNLYLLRVLLEGSGFEVAAAGNGAVALEMGRRDPPDMVITDVLMPVMDGFTLCRRWKADKRLTRIPFVFYTATYTDPKDEEFALNLGAEKFIVKPAEPERLVETLKDVYERFESGRLFPARPAEEDEQVYLREYNEALIRKLEDKMLQLEESNAKLNRTVAGLETEVARRHQAEVELRRLNEALEERVSERTAILTEMNQALEAFAFTVSHDLRTPLRVIQMLAESIEASQKIGDTPATILTAAKQMDQLIQDLLAYTRLNRANIRFEPVPLSSVLADCRARLRIPDGQLQVNEPLGKVLGDYLTLLQVVENLLSNAIKFTKPGELPRVRVWSNCDKDRIRLWVEDHGIGISDEDRERIFNVFERLHSPERYPGTGVGLAIVRKGVERLGGQVGLESKPGEGSRFWIDLPGAPSEGTSP